jgi:type I restriction enzyme, S subunit
LTPSGWTHTVVADIAAPDSRSIAIGPFGSSLRAELYTDHGVPLIRGQNISEGRQIDETDLVFVPQDVTQRFPACIVREGDLVFPHRGAIGRVAIVGKRQFMLSSSMMKLTCDPVRVDPDYVFYYFRGPGRRELLTRTSTVGTPGIGQPLKSLRGIPISFPPLPEQRGIAEVLGALDDKIAANAELIASTQALMTTLASTAPEGTTVASIARHSTASLRPEQFDEVVAHFSLPAFDQAGRPDLARGDSIKSNKFVVDSPCVLMSKLNPRIPRIWNVPRIPETLSLASTEFVLMKPLGVGPSELWSALSQPGVSQTLTEMVVGTSGSHQRVKPAEVLALHVPDPRTMPPATREAIVALGLVGHERRDESARLGAMRDALLPQLMSGKIRVKDAERVVEGVV